ncbi:hypothetical protein [Pararhodospirillum photometricum]|uniref:hypothetical protein n=1 Tax=Pararhodospirillum photometricum TaxID=1084 RepID=UPI0012FEE8F3|nr:hypothetical protein [Pararhodospirillum photometricum]
MLRRRGTRGCRPGPHLGRCPSPPVPVRPADKALSAECVWTGERVISLLARDDADMAERFVAFYDRFGCPMYRLGEAFSCVARSPVAQTTARATEGASLAEVASACWVDPAQEFTPPAAEPPAAGETPTPVTPMQQQ